MPTKRSIPADKKEALLRGVRFALADVASPVSNDEAIVLIVNGIMAGSAILGVSDRTIRRKFAARNIQVCRFVQRARIRAAVELLVKGAPTTVVAQAVGFTSSGAFRRFLRAHLHRDIRAIRRVVDEECPK